MQKFYVYFFSPVGGGEERGYTQEVPQVYPEGEWGCGGTPGGVYFLRVWPKELIKYCLKWLSNARNVRRRNDGFSTWIHQNQQNILCQLHSFFSLLYAIWALPILYRTEAYCYDLGTPHEIRACLCPHHMNYFPSIHLDGQTNSRIWKSAMGFLILILGVQMVPKNFSCKSNQSVPRNTRNTTYYNPIFIAEITVQSWWMKSLHF